MPTGSSLSLKISPSWAASCEQGTQYSHPQSLFTEHSCKVAVLPVTQNSNKIDLSIKPKLRPITIPVTNSQSSSSMCMQYQNYEDQDRQISKAIWWASLAQLERLSPHPTPVRDTVLKTYSQWRLRKNTKIDLWSPHQRSHGYPTNTHIYILSISQMYTTKLKLYR